MEKTTAKIKVEKIICYTRVFDTRWLHVFTMLFSALSFFSCIGQKPDTTHEENGRVHKPSWILSAKHPAFISERYVQGVGLAKASGNPVADRQMADQNAFSEIARQIFAQVSSEISVERMEVVGEKVETVLGRMVANSRIRTSLTVSGLKIVERYYDPSERIFYSLAILDRTAASAPHRSALARHETDYRNQLQEAERYLQMGRVLQAILSLKEAFHAAFRYQEVLPSFQLLAPRDGFGDLELLTPPSYVPVLSRLTEILSRLQLNIVEGDKQKFIMGKSLPAPLAVRLTLEGEKALPVNDVLVNFRFETGSGIISSNVRTNTDGLASSLVQKVGRTWARLYTVAAELDLRELADTTAYAAEWNRQLSAGARKVAFQFERKRAPTPTKVLILVEQSSQYGVRTSLAREVLSQELSEVGFSPLSETDIGSASAKMVRDAVQNGEFEPLRTRFLGAFEIIIVGEISVQPRSDVQGMKIFGASGLVKAVSLTTGLTLGAESFQDVRGFGNTEEQAAENAVRAATLKTTETIVGEILSSI